MGTGKNAGKMLAEIEQILAESGCMKGNAAASVYALLSERDEVKEQIASLEERVEALRAEQYAREQAEGKLADLQEQVRSLRNALDMLLPLLPPAEQVVVQIKATGPSLARAFLAGNEPYQPPAEPASEASVQEEPDHP